MVVVVVIVTFGYERKGNIITNKYKKETEGSCSNRSENNSEIKLNISRTSVTEISPLDVRLNQGLEY